MLAETKDKIKKSFSVICPEITLSDEDFDTYVDLISPMLSESRFGSMYVTAFVYLMAHYVVLRQLVTDGGASGSANLSIVSAVTSEKEGDLERSYGAGGGALDMLDKTYYGIEYKRLCSMCIVPVVTRLDNVL